MTAGGNAGEAVTALREFLALTPSWAGFAIFVTVVGLNLFGDGLRDALDPRLK